jgi:predicted oxidoreductase
MIRRTSLSGALALGVLALAAGCEVPGPTATDADVIVVGAGIAGLSAALEAERAGARVLLIDRNSVAGGHAVMAGGFALVDTALQRTKGYRDSPDIAFRDFMAWGEDSDAWWARTFAEQSGEQVYEWLTAMGVQFAMILDTPEDTVPRFHFTRGAAINAVLPLIRAALERGRIEFLPNTRVSGILRRDGIVSGVRTVNTRTGGKRLYRAGAVVLTTGGYQGNIEKVRETWPATTPPPPRLLIGASRFATGSGLELAEPFGAAYARLDHQVTFVNGLPDPRDPTGSRGLLTQNPAAIWVDSTGRRFTNELASSKVTGQAVLRQAPGGTHWIVFDAAGARQLVVRGTAWLSTQAIRREILDNPALVKQSDTIPALAKAAGLPADALAETVRRFNRFVEQGMDTDFGRIGPGAAGPSPTPIRQPPFYAMQLFPMTRKSMGGLVIDHETQVLGGAGQRIRGLFAAGEVTGVAGINGSHGGSGTFLGPSVLTGRIAGRNAARLALGGEPLVTPEPETATATAPAVPPGDQARKGPTDLAALLARQRRGYWHFNVSHRLVTERGTACETCHKGPWAPGPAISRAERLTQLDSCTRCH